MASKKDIAPARRLSLFEIEAGWIPLVEARITAETDPELSDDRPVCQCCGGRGSLPIPAGQPAEAVEPTCEVCSGSGREQSQRERAIEAADVALAEHSEKEVLKVDGYYNLILYLEAAASVRRAEAARNATGARIIEAIVESVKAAGVNAITVIPGRKRVEGTCGYLLAKTNGGLAPLLIDEEMLPDDVCKLEGSIGAHEYMVMVEATRRRLFNADWRPTTAKFKRLPDNTAIRAKLAEPCPTCKGKKTAVVTAAAYMSAAALESGASSEEIPCAACGGSGTSAVPGARYGERGVHLELK